MKPSSNTADMTKGSPVRLILTFSIPLIIGNIFQQLYNMVDTVVVGNFVGSNALGAVGACGSISWLFFSLSSGLALGIGIIVSQNYGAKQFDQVRATIANSFYVLIFTAIVVSVVCYLIAPAALRLLKTPDDIIDNSIIYMRTTCLGIVAITLYNGVSSILQALGNSKTPLIFLASSALFNIILSIILVVNFQMGVAGSALGTVIAQGFCALGLTIYTIKKCPELIPQKEHCKFDLAMIKDISNSSLLTSTQQSIMNFGILLVQNLVNSFGATVMAAFTVAVKIDSLAYMPAQDFGNAFSTFIGQNYGAKKTDRIQQGIKSAIKISFLFCLIISVGVFIFARPLMTIFIDSSETEIINIGVDYLRIEGSFYFGIGILFLLYGFYRATNFPSMSVILTIISLGTRVGLAYYLASIPSIGVIGIWWSIPIGWALADIFGIVYYKRKIKQLHF